MTRACTNGWFFIEGDGNKRRTLREELKAVARDELTIESRTLGAKDRRLRRDNNRKGGRGEKIRIRRINTENIGRGWV